MCALVYEYFGVPARQGIENRPRPALQVHVEEGADAVGGNFKPATPLESADYAHPVHHAEQQPALQKDLITEAEVVGSDERNSPSRVNRQSLIHRLDARKYLVHR